MFFYVGFFQTCLHSRTVCSFEGRLARRLQFWHFFSTCLDRALTLAPFVCFLLKYPNGTIVMPLFFMVEKEPATRTRFAHFCKTLSFAAAWHPLFLASKKVVPLSHGLLIITKVVKWLQRDGSFFYHAEKGTPLSHGLITFCKGNQMAAAWHPLFPVFKKGVPLSHSLSTFAKMIKRLQRGTPFSTHRKKWPPLSHSLPTFANVVKRLQRGTPFFAHRKK